MNKLFRKLVNINKSSLLIFIIGLVVQMFISLLSVLFGEIFNSGIMKLVLCSLLIIPFLIPFVSIIGIGVSIYQINKRKELLFPILGLALNLIWFILFWSGIIYFFVSISNCPF